MNPTLVALDPSMIGGLMALSSAAHWNQNEADWRCLLELGHGWGLQLAPDDGARRLAASTLVLPYEGRFAWVSMVLVLPEFRGRGLAGRLLTHAVAELERRGLVPVLDATPAGRPVYLEQGFVDAWGFARWRRAAGRPLPAAATAPNAPDARVRRLHDTDWPAIATLDAPAFGADRTALLRRLAQRLPAAAWVLDDGGVRAFLLGRSGRTAVQLGPLVAEREEDAQALLGAALAPARAACDRGAQLPALIADLQDGRADLRRALERAGFVFERPFTRMVRGAAAAPGDAARVALVAGPELG